MVDRVEISVIIDNCIDIFLPSTDVATYPVPGSASKLLAEQGLSLWIDVCTGAEKTRILYDFGRSSTTFFHNLGILGFHLADADMLVLSHGHVDHYGALKRVIRRTRDDCRLFLHPGAIGRKRYVQLDDGGYAGPWEVRPRDLEAFARRITYTEHASRPFPDICISGHIERRTDYEKGMPNAFVKEGAAFVHDEIHDDQALFIDLAGKGIVVITGCCHSGLVNTLLKAEEVFPGKGVYAVIGGLHLNRAPARQMEETMKYLSSLGITYLAALHCTGYQAGRMLAERFRDQSIPGTTGARITF
jgi:7,8-dihydropterin-6-yl-methyl-4-(beta-D-ribofuranosyl)aminobenzene 5'-phosphate synthase